MKIRKWWFALPVFVVLAISISLAPRTIAVAPVVSKDLTTKYASPLLKRACSCESWGDPNKEPREFDEKGKLIIGYPNPSDIGACQINTTLWLKTAKKLGFNIYTLNGNVSMANYIYSVQGIEAWKWSESCWAK